VARERLCLSATGRTNLSVSGKRALKLLLGANKRLNTAYLLKESFGQLWDYEREAWARKFFENWRASLKWQRLKKYEKFAAMIDEHWDGIAAYCKPENKVSLGYVEGLNNKIRVIQRRAYGLRDEEYLRLKVHARCRNFAALVPIGRHKYPTALAALKDKPAVALTRHP
jgi:transposase